MDKIKGIKGVFFDLGGTLIYPPSGSWSFPDFTRKFFPKESLEGPKAAAALKKATEAMDSRHLVHSIEEEWEQRFLFYRILVHELNLNVEEKDLRWVTDEMIRNQSACYGIFEDTIPTLQALYGKVKLGIISDTWPSIVPVLESFDILKYFDCVTYSYFFGVFKPNPKMYQDALSKMGLPPEETVFVDDLPKNLLGAQKQGIHPVLIRALPGVEPREDMPSINRTSGILDLLEF